MSINRLGKDNHFLLMAQLAGLLKLEGWAQEAGWANLAGWFQPSLIFVSVDDFWSLWQ